MGYLSYLSSSVGYAVCLERQAVRALIIHENGVDFLDNYYLIEIMKFIRMHDS